MKLLNEIRFLSVSTLVFMLISMFAVSYLFFFHDTDHHLGNNPGCGNENPVDPPEFVSDSKQNKGKILFKSNCARCHYITDQKMIGPGLKGVMTRINEKQFISWVQDPAKVRQKDPYFKKLYKEYDESVMPSFKLTDEEILSIISYVDNTSVLEKEVVAMK